MERAAIKPRPGPPGKNQGPEAKPSMVIRVNVTCGTNQVNVTANLSPRGTEGVNEAFDPSCPGSGGVNVASAADFLAVIGLNGV